jgi:hypothetical protein
VQVFGAAVALMVRSMVLSAQSAAQQRLVFPQRAVAAGCEAGEPAGLRDGSRRLQSENRLLKTRFGDAPCRKRYGEGMHVPGQGRWIAQDDTVS